MPRSTMVILSILAVISACHSDATAPKPTDFAVGIYNEYSRNDTIIPQLVSQDSHCTTVNVGGWLSLEAGGTYTLLMDQIETMCDTAATGGIAWAQKGTYVRNGATITLTPLPTDGGGSMIATFDSGTYSRATGGQLPTLNLTDTPSHYLLTNNGIAAVRAR